MKAPVFIRPLTQDERSRVQAGLRSSDAFVLRRCQMLLASDRGERAPVIAKHLGCHKQTVLTVIHGFNVNGLAVLQEGSSRPHRLRTTFSEEGLERLQDLLHRSPRDFGKERGTWTLELVTQVSFEQGNHPDAGLRRKRAARPQTLEDQLEARQALDHQSRSAVPAQKKACDRLIAYASQHPEWAIGFLDEVWWSRFAQPHLHAWQNAEHPVRLIEQSWQKDDPDPKALACYGVLWQRGSPEDPDRSQVWLRFVRVHTSQYPGERKLVE